jgi:hypothetical protein
MSVEAMKLALEALEEPKEHIVKQRRLEAITALRQAIEQAQEPVAWKETDEVECPVCKGKGFPWPKCGHITYLERTPPQRLWVGLTEEDCGEVGRWVEFKEEGSGRIPTEKLIRYIEAKLKEKNA